MNTTTQNNDKKSKNSKLITLAKRQRLPFVEGLRRAKEKGLVLASNIKIDNTLNGMGGFGHIDEIVICWSGTLTAYVQPGKKLGKVIEYTDTKTGERWVFPVKKEYQNEKDVLLVSEHPDYELEMDGKNIIIHTTKVDLVERFPASDGSYQIEEKHGIPSENGGMNKRHLWRIDKRVGPIASVNFFVRFINRKRHYILLNIDPSECLEMLVEVQENK